MWKFIQLPQENKNMAELVESKCTLHQRSRSSKMCNGSRPP